jgi:hypothetical protein
VVTFRHGSHPHQQTAQLREVSVTLPHCFD